MARMRDRLRRPGADRRRRRVRLPRRARPAGAGRDAALRPRVAVPARAGAAPPVAALPAVQPALRVGFARQYARHRRRSADLRLPRFASRCASLAALVASPRSRRPRGRFDDNPADGLARRRATRTSSRAPPTARSLERHRDRRAAGRTGPRSAATPTSGPAAVGYGNAINVFVRGTDGAVYQNTLDATAAGADWRSLGGVRHLGAGGDGPARAAELRRPRRQGRRQRDLAPDVRARTRGWSAGRRSAAT